MEKVLISICGKLQDMIKKDYNISCHKHGVRKAELYLLKKMDVIY